MLQKFHQDESGATAIEYGLIAALVAIGMIAGANAIANGLNGVFNEASTTLDTTNAPTADPDDG